MVGHGRRGAGRARARPPLSARAVLAAGVSTAGGRALQDGRGTRRLPMPLRTAPPGAEDHARPPPPPQAVAIAVVIPAHGQPGLLPEAIASVLGQRGAPPIAAVVVEDGCPFPETRRGAAAFAAAHPGRVFALHRPNGGLPAARNTGIAFALAAFPALRAIYFLDADNRLHPPFLARAHAALMAAPDDVGWVYPDFDRFGIAAPESSRAWSLLAELSENMCEAGSLVRRSVFAEAGLRFDETLRSGFEDWDFWLRCARAGFRGVHLPDAGFRYRRRPESMLAEAERQRAALLEALRRRHAPLFAPRSLLALEAAEAPRHALYDAADPAAPVRLLLDPEAEAPAEALSAAAARARLLEEAPAATAVFPEILAFADPAALAALGAARLVRGLFWQAAQLLREGAEAVAVEILPAGERDEAALLLPPGPAAAAGAGLLFLARAALRAAAGPDAAPGRLESLGGERPLPATRRIRILLPRDIPVPPAEGAPLRRLLLEAALLREASRRTSGLPGPGAWRGTNLSARAGAARRAAAAIGAGTLLPWQPGAGARAIGFVQPLFTLGGVERVVVNQAAVLRRHGWGTRLVVLGGGDRALLPPAARAAFDDILLLPGGARAYGASDWRNPHAGAETSAFGADPAAPEVLGLLAGLDAVVNTHSLAAQALMARLRRMGTRTYAAMHLVERGPWGQPIGTPHTATAYEHAYDGALVISEGLRDWCLAQGWPEAKIHLVRNAPGHPATLATVAAALAARAAPRPPGGRLRALFLGRLDAQKGVDRLAALIAATRDVAEWRVVGRPVLEEAPPELGLAPEPPVSDPAALDALHAWADVLVLPSRFEGVPLVVLEAQRMGCAVLATDAGETAEIVTDGVDGFLVRQAGLDEPALVAAMAARLRMLAADAALRLEVGRRAAARVAGAGWETVMQGFLDHLDRVVPPRRPRDGAA